MANKVPTWVWVVIGIVVVSGLGLVAVAGMGVYFVVRQVETQAASPAAAEQTFERARERFKDQKPLLELDDDDNIKATNLDQPVGAVRKLETLSVMAWDSDDERIVHVEVPFWLLRFKEDPLDILSSSGIHGQRIRITVADIERMGPRLLIDHRGRRGDRVLVWTQ
ncbi:MAG TPA: hypothetical protein VHJ77_04815 [Vicinamibacterales bacterium]|jgi:hypothetical protein|nr:hypothetical protein [Vicinamibacterales bacterium]